MYNLWCFSSIIIIILLFSWTVGLSLLLRLYLKSITNIESDVSLYVCTAKTSYMCSILNHYLIVCNHVYLFRYFTCALKHKWYTTFLSSFPPQTLHNFINLYQAMLRALKASIMYISSQIQTFNLRCFHILLNRVELISVLKPGCVWKSCVSYIMWFLYLVFLLLPLLKTLCVFQVLQVGEQVRKALLDGLPFLPKRTTQHQRM